MCSDNGHESFWWSTSVIRWLCLSVQNMIGSVFRFRGKVGLSDFRLRIRKAGWKQASDPGLTRRTLAIQIMRLTLRWTEDGLSKRTTLLKTPYVRRIVVEEAYAHHLSRSCQTISENNPKTAWCLPHQYIHPIYHRKSQRQLQWIRDRRFRGWNSNGWDLTTRFMFGDDGGTDSYEWDRPYILSSPQASTSQSWSNSMINVLHKHWLRRLLYFGWQKQSSDFDKINTENFGIRHLSVAERAKMTIDKFWGGGSNAVVRFCIRRLLLALSVPARKGFCSLCDVFPRRQKRPSENVSLHSTGHGVEVLSTKY